LGAAEESLERGLAMQPGHPLLPVTIKVLLSAVSEADARLALLDRIIARTGDQFAPLEIKGYVLVAMGELSQARALFRILHERAPDEPLVMRKLVAMEHAGRNGDRVIEILESWRSRHPNDVDSGLMLAQAYSEQGRAAAAIELLTALLQDQPGNAGVLNNLAWLLSDSDAERALTYAERAHRLQPTEASIMDTLGTLLLRKGDLERSLALLDEARIADRTASGITLHYAQALNEAGRNSEARVILLELLVDKPSAEQSAARALLEKIDR
jgi:predicted Zn-dependent protease